MHIISTIIGCYYLVALFSVVALDFYKSQVLEDGQENIAAYAGVHANCRRGIYLDEHHGLCFPRIGEHCPECLKASTLPKPERMSFVDRTFLNLFKAPFVFPIEAIRLMRKS